MLRPSIVRCVVLFLSISCWTCVVAQVPAPTPREQPTPPDEVSRQEVGGMTQSGAEEWAQLHDAEMKRWADEQAQHWAEWSKAYEQHWKEWSEQHEQHWKEWAKTYEQEWKNWEQAWQQGQYDPAQLRQLYQRNLEMLGQMPLQELTAGVVEQTERLKDAPWEGLAEAQALVRQSIASALRDMESSTNTDASADVATRLEVLKKTLQELQERLNVVQQQLDHAARRQLKAARQQMESLERERQLVQKETAKSALRRALEQETRARLQQAVDAKVLEQQRRAIEQQQRLLEESLGDGNKALLSRELERARVRSFQQPPALPSEASMQRHAETIKAQSALIQRLSGERQQVVEKDAEIQVLRDEIRQLRKELEQQKAKKGPKRVEEKTGTDPIEANVI